MRQQPMSVARRMLSRAAPKSACSSTINEASLPMTSRRSEIAVVTIGVNRIATLIASRTVAALITAIPRRPCAATPICNPR